MSIPRGVTPTFTLTFADNTLDLTQAEHVYVSFVGGSSILKSDAELTVAERSISVYLTQEETLSFREGTCEIQANWTYSDGSRGASKVVNYTFGKQLLNRKV